MRFLGPEGDDPRKPPSPSERDRQHLEYLAQRPLRRLHLFKNSCGTPFDQGLPKSYLTLPMRVLHLIPTLGLSGAEKQLSYLAAALKSRGVDCHVACFRRERGDTVTRSYLDAAGVPIHQLYGRSPYDPRLLASIRRLVRRLRPDLVQTWLAMMDVAGGIALRGLDVPWVMSERNNPDLLVRDTKMRLRERVVPWCTAVVANSNSGRDYWRSRLGPPVLSSVVRNAVTVEAIRSAAPADPSAIGLPIAGPLVLYIGRLVPQKNVAGLLEALARVLRGSNASAAVVGDGPGRDDVRVFARRHCLEGRLVAPGFIASPWSWLRRADVFVSLSHAEGMPNTVMEAMAAGCPLVLSDITPHRELVDADGAHFVSPDSPEAAATAIESLLGDKNAADQRGAQNQKLAESWTIDRAVEGYLDAYRSVL